MGIIEAILIGIVQGITEFIPISSSGHLVLAQYLLGVDQPGITFEVFLHFGSLFSVFYCFYKDIIELIISFKNLIGNIFIKKDRVPAGSDNLLVMLIISTIITGIIGISFKGFFERLFDVPAFVTIMLIFTGLILILASICQKGKKSDIDLTYKDSIIVGLFQSLAILPGISRSGSTLCGAFISDIDTDTAVRYSFILSIPAIAGATLLEIKDIFLYGFDNCLLIPYIAGMVASAVSGIFAIKILIRVLKQKKLFYFAIYCIITGLLGTIYFTFFF